jgi:hypothetical protein
MKLMTTKPQLFILNLGGSIETVVRAVWYIEQAHAIPPIGNSTTWFSTVLQTFMEIAFPNSEITGPAIEFYFDMENGINYAFQEKLCKKD